MIRLDLLDRIEKHIIKTYPLKTTDCVWKRARVIEKRNIRFERITNELEQLTEEEQIVRLEEIENNYASTKA